MEAARSPIAASKPLSTSSICGCAASGAPVRGGERCRAADHVLEHASDREVGARRLTVELLCADSADDVAKKCADLAELGQGIHCSSVRVEWTDRDASAALGGFAVKAGCDESRHLVRLVHDTIFALDDRGCRRARAPFSAGAADPSWGEHPIATALAAENVAVTARCGRTATRFTMGAAGMARHPARGERDASVRAGPHH